MQPQIPISNCSAVQSIYIYIYKDIICICNSIERFSLSCSIKDRKYVFMGLKALNDRSDVAFVAGITKTNGGVMQERPMRKPIRLEATLYVFFLSERSFRKLKILWLIGSTDITNSTILRLQETRQENSAYVSFHNTFVNLRFRYSSGRQSSPYLRRFEKRTYLLDSCTL